VCRTLLLVTLEAAYHQGSRRLGRLLARVSQEAAKHARGGRWLRPRFRSRCGDLGDKSEL
jgi:hypothetical protein